MLRTIKYIAAILAAVSAFTSGGDLRYAPSGVSGGAEVYTDSEDSPEEKRGEAVETPDFKPADAEKLLTFAGSAEGIEFYIRDENYEEEIWASHGGKPEKDEDISGQRQQEVNAAEADIKTAKEIGDAAALSSSGAVARFNKLADRDGEIRYISTGGRFLVITDDSGRIKNVCRVISTLDSKNAFLTDDGKTLMIMTEDNKSTDAQFTFSRTENGMRIYTGETADEYAQLSEDMTRFYGVFRCCAENSSYRMIADYRDAVIGLENKETGYIWWSTPPDASQDTSANEALVRRMRSSNTMNYGVPQRRNNTNPLASFSDECDISVTDIENGIRVEYSYDAGFTIPVEYTLEEDCLKALLKADSITETNSSNIATEVTIMGSFGAASDEEEGYFVIPDGCGAIVNFNNNKSMEASSYSQPVYGRDITAVPTSRGAVTEQIYLPVYGIVKENNALLAVAARGDANARLNVQVSGDPGTRYNFCNFTFVLRGTDTYYMSGNGNEAFTVFENGGIKTGDIEMRYYPVSGGSADYSGIARRYRRYLIEEKGMTVRTDENTAPLYIDLYGGVQKKKSILGIPMTVKQSVTSFEQAEGILSRLKGSGAEDMVISYENWTNDGIGNKIDTDAVPAHILGGKKGFSSLKSYVSGNGWSLYPASDNRDFRSGNGYYSFTDTAVRISGAYSRIVSYDRAYGIPDGFRKNLSLLSPEYFGKVSSGIAESYAGSGLYGVAASKLTTSLYGDYGRHTTSRSDAMDLLTESYSRLDETLPGGIIADGANAYALPYVSHIKNVPLSSSRFDIFDRDIPFYQIVVHGLVPYSTTAVNGSADSRTMLLMAAATGSCLRYDMICEETSVLKDTELDTLFYAESSGRTDTAGEEYALLRPLLEKIGACTIEEYDVSGDIITTEYSDGTKVITDMKNGTVSAGEIFIDIDSYFQGGEDAS